MRSWRVGSRRGAGWRARRAIGTASSDARRCGMEVEDVVYLRAAREVFEASDAAMAPRMDVGRVGTAVTSSCREAGASSLVVGVKSCKKFYPRGRMSL